MKCASLTKVCITLILFYLLDRTNLILIAIELRDIDGKEYELPPWTSKSEGAATIITGMIDTDIGDSNGSFLHNNTIADEELHSHIRYQPNWRRLWELSEKLIEEKFLL